MAPVKLSIRASVDEASVEAAAVVAAAAEDAEESWVETEAEAELLVETELEAWTAIAPVAALEELVVEAEIVEPDI